MPSSGSVPKSVWDGSTACECWRGMHKAHRHHVYTQPPICAHRFAGLPIWSPLHTWAIVRTIQRAFEALYTALANVYDKIHATEPTDWSGYRTNKGGKSCIPGFGSKREFQDVLYTEYRRISNMVPPFVGVVNFTYLLGVALCWTRDSRNKLILLVNT